MSKIDFAKIKDGAREIATSDAAKLVATAVVTTAALVGTHLAIKQIEKGQDPQ